MTCFCLWSSFADDFSHLRTSRVVLGNFLTFFKISMLYCQYSLRIGCLDVLCHLFFRLSTSTMINNFTICHKRSTDRNVWKRAASISNKNSGQNTSQPLKLQHCCARLRMCRRHDVWKQMTVSQQLPTKNLVILAGISRNRVIFR